MAIFNSYVYQRVTSRHPQSNEAGNSAINGMFLSKLLVYWRAFQLSIHVWCFQALINHDVQNLYLENSVALWP